ncbi:nuclear pore complex protein Nup160-like [Ciona intestinalis]
MMDDSLIFLEVPLMSTCSDISYFQDINVDAYSENSASAENISFEETGGGLQVVHQLRKHHIYWKISGNTLELFEYATNTDMQQIQFRITFNGSKIAPGFKLVNTGGQLVILCATTNRVYKVHLPISRLKERYLLSGLSASHFENPKNRFDFDYPDNIVTSSACLSPGHATFVFALMSGDLAVIKMFENGKGTCHLMKKNSRISRIWSGLNPWAGNTNLESPNDLAIFNPIKGDQKVIAICKDHKIRIWSCKKLDCEAHFDATLYLEKIPDLLEIGQNHQIRVCSNLETKEFFFCVHLLFSNESVLLNFQFDPETCDIHHLSTLYCPCQSTTTIQRLVDFQLSSDNQLWALWQDTDDQPTLAVCDIIIKTWHEVAMSQPLSTEVTIPYHSSVPEEFLKKIFNPRKFCLSSIRKALSVHQRTPLSSRNPSMKSLQDDVVKLMETEVAYNLPDEDNLKQSLDEIQLLTWSTFYTSCVQYQQYASKPIAITNPNGCIPTIVKKGYVSQQIPVSMLEAVCRGVDASLLKFLYPVADDSVFTDLVKMLNCLSLLSSILGKEYLEELAQSVQLCDNPATFIHGAMEDIKESINENSDETELEDCIGQIGDIISTIRVLLMCLEPGPIEHELDPSNCCAVKSDFGLELLLSATHQYVEDRLHLVLLLLIVTVLLDELQESFAERVAVYVHSYSAIMWAVTAEKEHVPNTSIEHTLQSLSVGDSKGSSRTLLEGFLKNEGGKLLCCILRENSEQFNGVIDNAVIPKAIAGIIQLLWPLGPTVSFPKYLFTNSLFGSLQYYINIRLNKWCDFSPAYIAYMLAYCYLHNGQYNKAVHTFVQAGGKAGMDEILIGSMLELDLEEQLGENEIEVLFYTKVLEIFEKLDLAEQVIILAKHAISKASAKDDNMPILCSSMFRQCLQLNRFNEAYKAIFLNPSWEHKKDCLRTLVMALCERKKYKLLVEHSYDDMHVEVVNILEHRARCSDLLNSRHKYYDLLFSFHVHRGNYGRAASTMYEQMCRLQNEYSASPSPNVLHLQHMCLVSTVSCLRLVDKQYRWLVHPIDKKQIEYAGCRSPKRNAEGEALPVENSQRKIRLIEFDQLQNELLLLECRMKLALDEENELNVGASASEKETLSLLVHSSYFNDAFIICDKFKLDKKSVFEVMCTRCIYASYSNDDAQIWSWLKKNEIRSSDAHSSASDVAWRFLETSLSEHGEIETHKSSNYRAVLQTLLSYSYPLPAWFVKIYKKINCPEIIRMLLCYDWLELSTSLCVDYMNAVMGVSPAEFGIHSSLLNINKQVWSPQNEISQLLLVLDDMRHEEKYNKLYKTLFSKREEYFEEIKRVSATDRFHASMVH